MFATSFVRARQILCRLQRNIQNAYLLGAFERVVSGYRHCKDILVGVDKSVSDRDDSGVVEGQGDSGDGLDTFQEPVHQFGRLDVEDMRREDRAVVVDLNDLHTVREGRNVHHVEQSRFGGTDTVSSVDDLDVADNFDGTTGNLGGDTQSLEEGGLARFHTGVTSGDGDIDGSESTGTSGSSDGVAGNGCADVLEITGSEDEADVATDVGHETFVLGRFGEEDAKSAADHGVLAHQDDTGASEGDTDLMHLVRADVINVDDEDGG